MGRYITQEARDIMNEVFQTTNPNLAVKTLQDALKHMEDRSSTYDKKDSGERSMSKTVDAFNTITGQNLTEEQGWLFMVLLKAVRSQQGHYKSDNYEDGAAYFGLANEAAFKERT